MKGKLKKLFTLFLFFVLSGVGCVKNTPSLLSTNKSVEKVDTLQLFTTSTVSESDLAAVSSTIAVLAKHIARMQITGWKMPTSSQRGVPLNAKKFEGSAWEETLSIYNFDLDKLTVIGRNIVGVNQEPFVAPNFLFTAYINNNQSLYIISNDNFKKSLIYQGSKNSPVSLIGWSSDSTRLFFSTSIKDGEDAGGPVYKLAYYNFFDAVDGHLVSIPYQEKFSLIRFLDDRHILVSIGAMDHHFVSALNLDTMQLEHKWFNEKFGLMSAVFHGNWVPTSFEGSLSADGRKFVGNKSELGNEEYASPVPGRADKSYSSIIYGDNKNKVATVLAKGQFAQYQSALISPSGNQVAYEEEAVGEFPPTIIWIYDAATGQKWQYKDKDNYGFRIEHWLDNDRLLFSTYEFSITNRTSPITYEVLSVNSHAVKIIWDSSKSNLQ